jgi:hypothetical protein
LSQQKQTVKHFKIKIWKIYHQKEVLAYEKASRRVKELKSFYGNLTLTAL